MRIEACPHCGESLPRTLDAFCPYCRESLEELPPTAAEPQHKAPLKQPGPTPDPQPLPSRAVVPRSRIPIHNAEEQEGLRVAGAFAAKVMQFLRPHVVPGRTTKQIDTLAHDFMLDHGCRPPMLNLRGFPASTCISTDDGIVNGIPSSRVVGDSSIVKISLAVLVDGWHSACARTIRMPAISETAHQLAETAERCLRTAIDGLSPDCPVSQIGDVISQLATKAGFSVVREYVGHGIGRKLHQDPSVPGCPTRQSRNVFLAPGSCFSIEPILNAGLRHTRLEEDGWTVRTRDGSLSAECKDTVLMTENGADVLTWDENDAEEAARIPPVRRTPPI